MNKRKKGKKLQRRMREIERQRKRGRQKAALSCSLVLREHIYFPLISNALVNFPSLFIATSCDLCLAACRKKKKVPESIRQLLQTLLGFFHVLCFLRIKKKKKRHQALVIIQYTSTIKKKKDNQFKDFIVRITKSSV